MEIQTTQKSSTVSETELYKLKDIKQFYIDVIDPSAGSETVLLRELLSPYKLNSVFGEFIIGKIVPLKKFFFLDENTRITIDQLKENHFNSIIDLEPFNSIRDINNYFEKINTKLTDNGILLGYFIDSGKSVYNLETTCRILKKQIRLVHNIRSAWTSFRRIMKKITFMSKVEFYGRLSCYGFEIQDEITYHNKLFFAATKKRAPLHIKKNQHGIFIKLPRICKNGKVKYFYKIRTMYPYSEYLQEYIWKVQGLQDGGKINSDFRVSSTGRFLRKYWIDEIPMIFNFLRGDIKLVGVRPLSRHYFSLYSKELQTMRIKTRPGLIPPFYVDFPKSLDEIMESEKKYLLAYERNPVATDITYFFKAVMNILFNGYRSK